jgi:hypothetical protein
MDHGGSVMARYVRRLASLARLAQVLSASIALWLVVVSSASAATDIQGTPDDLRLDVDNATLSEVLDALSSRFQISYKLRSHNPRILTGHYSGTLRETVTRLLDGNDYFLELSDKGLEVIVLGASGPQNTPPRQVASVPSPTAPPPAPAATPKPSVASPRPMSPSIPALSASSVPPLSSFAVPPPFTP